MMASKKIAPLAALIRKLALNDARVIQAASIQATRSFNTNAMREVEALDDKLNLGRGSDCRVAWRRVDNDCRVFPFSQIHSVTDYKDFRSADRVPTVRPPRWREDENRLEIRVYMPGLGKEHVKLSVEQNELIIEGDGEEEKGEEEGARRYKSRISLTDSRNDSTDVYKLNEIEAEMKNGILEIVVPKVKEEERKDVFQINVK